MEVSWSVPHVSQGRGPEETDGGMAINQLVLGGWSKSQQWCGQWRWGLPYPAKVCISKPCKYNIGGQRDLLATIKQ